jgi:integration host factor subunit alpha
MTLTKTQLTDGIHRKIDLPKGHAAKALETLLEITKKILEDGEDVLISGFGKFCLKTKNARRGRNPQTGEALTLGSRRGVIFKCSGVLKEKINGEK